MHRVEWVIVRSASVVIVICPELRETVEALAPGKPVVLIENTAVAAEEAEASAHPTELATRLVALRTELALPEGSGSVLVYTGTFEHYQGLDLLVESLPVVLQRFPGTIVVLAGGTPEQIAAREAQARRLGVAAAIRFAGQRAPAEMPVFMQLADVLLSPRSEGTNTPLKIYSYLHAGKPIVATHIRSHTQVLTPETALLVEPTAAALASGITTVLADDTLRYRLARDARALARRDYSYETFLSRTAQTYQLLAPRLSAG
ncbi:MAG: glycosyltransferase family 4 protein [Ktedonobacterales bacterium]|nr:glycosyltransferase family 4 protein [Ktedonobacterales bacterium]